MKIFHKIIISIYGLYLRLRGWKFINHLSDEEVTGNAVVVAAPHTSFMDGFIGNWLITSLGWDSRFICAPWLLKNKFWKFCLSFCNPMPAGVHIIQNVQKEFEKNDNLKVVICPEAKLKPTDKWSESFYHMAVKSNVPLLIVTFNYKEKLVQIVDRFDIGSPKMESSFTCMKALYKYMDPSEGYVMGKYPEKYLPPKKNVFS